MISLPVLLFTPAVVKSCCWENGRQMVLEIASLSSYCDACNKLLTWDRESSI